MDDTGQAIEWQKTIGGEFSEWFYSIKQTTDGGYILGGISDSGISGDKTEGGYGADDIWVVKLDGTGNLVWQNTIGGNNNDRLRSIQQTTDGGYILGGTSDSGISGDKTEASQGNWDYWVVKLNSTGNIVWENTIGGNNRDLLRSIRQTTDGGYILGGASLSGISGDKTEASHGNSDYWVVKLDDTGQAIEWQKTIGGEFSEWFYSIRQTTDGGYILGGASYSGISGDKTEASQGNSDYWVVKLNDTGQTIEWQKTIGGSHDDELHSIEQTTDGGYILGGDSWSEISGDKIEYQGNNDYWVVKLDGTGKMVGQNTIGGSISDELWSIAQTTDEGYILGGWSNSEISGDKTEDTYEGSYDYWVVKLNAITSLTVEYPQLTTMIEGFSVLPAYPNPFNPNTTIRYGLEKDSYVTVKIYDIESRLITTLQNNNQTQGWHSVVWNGTNNFGEQVPTGLYLSKITSNNNTKTIKLMLLK